MFDLERFGATLGGPVKLAGVIGNGPIVKHLLATHQADHLPSAFLFLGPEGIGKSTLVRSFAEQINCESQSACGHCENCRLFRGGSHPDFIVVTPQGKNIRIAQIQGLISALSLRPMYAKKRVALVKSVERLNQESANAFLKILEEPPLDTLLVLTASDRGQLMDTLLSRCQELNFSPLSAPELQQVLDQHFPLEPLAKALVLRHSEGRVRKDLIEKAAQLVALEEHIESILFSQRPEALTDHFVWIESLVKQELERFFLEFLAGWFRDMLLHKQSVSAQPYSRASFSNLNPRGLAIPPEVLAHAFDLTIETEVAIKAQAGRQLALEGLLLKLNHLFRGALVL